MLCLQCKWWGAIITIVGTMSPYASSTSHCLEVLIVIFSTASTAIVAKRERLRNFQSHFIAGWEEPSHTSWVSGKASQNAINDVPAVQ
jgi:hypothetical protein